MRFSWLHGLVDEVRGALLNASRGGDRVLWTRSPVWKSLVELEARKYLQAWALLGELLGPSPVVLDAGAHHGYDTIEMCAAWRDAMFYAVEPMDATFEVLRANTRRLPYNCSRARRIRLRSVALSDRVGSALLRPVHHTGTFSASSLFNLTAQARAGHRHYRYKRPRPVGTMTLDAFAESVGLERIDFLRLDMEGAEAAVLRASRTILPTVKLIQVEVLPGNRFARSEKDSTSLESFLRLLAPHGWRLIWTSVGSKQPQGEGDAFFVHQTVLERRAPGGLRPSRA